MTDSERRWNAVGRKLWPWLKMLPISGCDRELLEAVSEVANLLGTADESVISLGQLSEMEAALDSDACNRVADAVVRDRWIMRLEKSKRAEFEQYLRSGDWLK